MMITYAQNFEDVMLARVLAGITRGFYLDVGANDPVVGSVTKHFYDAGWSGINVEPVARFHAALVRDRPRDVNLRVALGRERGTLTFFDFETMGISTLSADFAEQHVREGHRYVRREIEVVPLREICESHCHGPIDFMKVDVEGFEREVLEGGDWTRYRPRVLVVEATRPNSHVPAWHEWEPFVIQQGYLFAYYDGLNRYYVAQEERSRLERFELPPNVLDGFEPYETHRLRRELAEHQRAFTLAGFLPFVVRKLSAKLRRLLRDRS
jgi:FkbM family methyltransferase